VHEYYTFQSLRMRGGRETAKHITVAHSTQVSPAGTGRRPHRIVINFTLSLV